MNEIPKDKRVFVHCSTGARADLAYRELVDNGYDVKFLLLNISDPECDCPILMPELDQTCEAFCRKGAIGIIRLLPFFVTHPSLYKNGANS